MRIKGINPISAVDDLSVHSMGPWIDDFSIGLSQAAKKENISIVGGEIAQMGSVYRSGYIGVVVYVVGIK